MEPVGEEHAGASEVVSSFSEEIAQTLTLRSAGSGKTLSGTARAVEVHGLLAPDRPGLPDRPLVLLELSQLESGEELARREFKSLEDFLKNFEIRLRTIKKGAESRRKWTECLPVQLQLDQGLRLW